MKKTNVIIGVFAAGLLIFGGMALAADKPGGMQVKHEEAEASRMAKIPMETAITTALKEVPGKAVRAELEEERGSLVYEIEIAGNDHRTMDVKVDADSGGILQTSPDLKDSEGKERKDMDHEKNEGKNEKED